jgi:hypothetical protein
MPKQTSFTIYVKERAKIECQCQAIQVKLVLINNSRPVSDSQCKGAGSDNSGRRKGVTQYYSQAKIG